MIAFTPIGTMHTSFTEKFGVPRQSGMVPGAKGVLKLRDDPAFADALNHLEAFSHVWIIFLFHKSTQRGWRPTVEPPRLGAPERMGVFASRSPHRPNPIGLSVVRLDRVNREAAGGIEIHVSGVDLLDGTPVLDLKPYVPYADSVSDARNGWATGNIRKYTVSFSEDCESSLAIEPSLRALVQQTLAWDPRPTPQRRTMPIEDPATEGKTFGFRLGGHEVQWEVRDGGIRVKCLSKLAPLHPPERPPV